MYVLVKLVAWFSLLLCLKPCTATSSNGYEGLWGTWGPIDTCPNGGYAVLFKQRVEEPRGSSDDTAMNGVCLICDNGEEICSKVGPWGTWEESSQRCNEGYKGFDIKFEKFQGEGSSDDTAANDIKMICMNGQTHTAPNGGKYGDWKRGWQCPSNQVICGLQTRVEDWQGDSDDTALNGVKVVCCKDPNTICDCSRGVSSKYYKFSGIDYDIDGSRVYKHEPERAGIQVINNENSSQMQSITFKVSKTVTTSESFEHATGASVTAGTEFSCGVPGLAEGKVSMEMEVRYDFTYGKTKEVSTTIEHEYTCKVAPYMSVKCEALVFEYETKIGYTMTWQHKKIPNCQCKTSGVLTQKINEMRYKVTERDAEKRDIVKWNEDEKILVV